MEYQLNVSVTGGRESLVRLAEVLDALKEYPPDGKLDEESEAYWRTRIPGWMVANFADQMSPQESRAWLRKWRRASVENRSEMEDAAGWELLDWLYWFSLGNEFWRIGGYSLRDSGEMVVTLSAANERVPMQALEWLIEKCGAKIASIG
ncbi:hypothetical protein [Streptomyces guryensis]|uniref:Uncharacterized protein n=1 Tax=Streptomyces guryensis TaxID=2886947 RepID=A0A9Q3VGP1_9ACTN|nr:hypothetical protein [Streptomyces guryensis]MCD9872268.1 hypothetical protein [Streptomyces guryensis]